MTVQCVPDYWQLASTELAKSDQKMAELVSRYHDASLFSKGDPFMTLARSVIGQQISVKAAQSIWQRFADMVAEVTPGNVLSCNVEMLKGCGLSARKVEYLIDLAKHFSDGVIHVDRWNQMSDADIIAELTAVRGIGEWTAQMFLIFHQMRPDVFPLDDIGLQKAVALYYNGGQRPSKKELINIGEKWRPWRSVATWYLWRSLDPLPVEY